MTQSSSSSTVKVEYTDFWGVFPLVSEDLQSRLPLRNLNWNSTSRPLRSIDSLYVDLVSVESASTQNEEQPGITPLEGDNAQTSKSKRQSSVQPAKRGRRHQIPGLRQTPYLKLFFLRCDDVEDYKDCRKRIREWIKTNAVAFQSSVSSSSQENHDASEWLIVHVLIPDVQSTSPWSTKSQSKILESLQSDFNGSSKSAVDRVVQIPCGKPIQVRGVTIDLTSNGLTRERSIQLSNALWVDIVVKMKSLILNTFDIRVRQYEEDIRDKATQRSMPGWNFCTYFILKEGLARGFESVGLIEDALTGYDELSAELQAAIRDQKSGTESGRSATIFRDHTQELSNIVQTALSIEDGKDQADTQTGFAILDADRKPYREMILASDISVFEFQNYVYSRQLTLLLRIAVQSKSTNLDESMSEPGVLADVCRRAITYITSIGPCVREELRDLLKFKVEADSATSTTKDVIENIISSLTFSAAQEIDEKMNGKLSITQSSGAQPASMNFPPRLSSVPERSITDLMQVSRPQSQQQQVLQLEGRARGNLALFYRQRAGLKSIKRRALTAVAIRKGYHVGWTTISLTSNIAYQDAVAAVGRDGRDGKQPPSPIGIINNDLKSATSSADSFRDLYDQLSTDALKLYQISGDTNASQALAADLAVLKYQEQDYEAAISYFEQIADFYEQSAWSSLDITVLDMYARCVKALGRNEDFVRFSLQILAVMISNRRKGLKAGQDGSSNVQGLLKHILTTSDGLAEPLSTTLEDFFSSIYLDPYLKHLEEKDGFQMTLTLKHDLDEDFVVQQIRVRLLRTGDIQHQEIWLSAEEGLILRTGMNIITITSNILFPGSFHLDQIVVHSHNLVFRHDTGSQQAGTQAWDPVRLQHQQRSINIWPAPRSFDVQASLSDDIHLDKPRAVMFELYSKQNDVLNGTLSLRAGSAGLRLHIADASLAEGNCSLEIKSSSIEFGPLVPGAIAKILVPYSLENEMKIMEVRSIVSYTTSQGSFTYGTSEKISSILSLGVNVQDVFKQNALFSRFSISTSTGAPLRITGCHLQDSVDFEATSTVLDKTGLHIFGRQPLSMVYKIRLRVSARSADPARGRLRLRIQYQCLDEEILAAVSSALERSIAASPYAVYERLLVSFLKAASYPRIQTQDLESIGILREYELGSPSALHWNEALIAVSPTHRAELAKWLEDWHKTHTTISLLPDAPFVRTRRVNILVDIPQMHVVHHARLALFDAFGGPLPPNRPLVIGEAIPAELTLTHTRRWASAGSVPASKPLTFCYDLEAGADTWVVGGQRRAYYSAQEEEAVRFSILLVPQRSGRVLLPSLDIHAVEPAGGGEGGDVGGGLLSAREMACEVDYASQGETVLVVPARGSVTVGLEPDIGGVGRLLAAEQRGVVLA